MTKAEFFYQTPKKNLSNIYLFKIWLLERTLGTNYTKMKDFATSHNETVETVIDRNFDKQVEENPTARQLIRDVKELVE